jgi:protein DGCR14
MAASGSQVLAKRSADTALMPPPPPPKRIKRPAKVLDEDTYADALSHIIARDFFPGLLETESQQEYLSALDSEDPEWIASAGKRLVEVMTPGPDGRRLRGKRGTGMTPAFGAFGRGEETPRGQGGETPMSAVSPTATATTQTETQTEEPEVDTNMSLGAFQKKYTSEDNESFYKLLDKQNEKKNKKYSWIWAGNKIPAARQIAYRKQRAELEASREAREAGDGKAGALAKYDLDTRPAMPDSWNTRSDNGLMFNPSSIEDTTQTVQQKAEEASRAGPKAVVYDNTRLAPEPSKQPEIPPSPSLSAVKAAVAGRPRRTESEIDFAGSATPRVNGYAFVDSEEPEPPTSTAATIDTSLLGPRDPTPNPFRIKESSSREALHHRMVDKVAKAKRKEKILAEAKTPVPKFASSPRIAKVGLTPAAQRLLGKVGRTPNAGEGIWEGRGKTPTRRSGLREEWNPKAG